KGFDSRARFRRADGEYRWTKSVGVPRFHSDKHFAGHVCGTFDITDMKEAEGALLEIDRGKNEFLAMVAHELRNPLSGVRNASRLLSETKDEKTMQRALDIIDRQTGHMVRMVDDLLNVSRITQGKIQLHFTPVDLKSIVEHSIEANAMDRRTHDQCLNVSLSD